MARARAADVNGARELTLFLCGDVMTGRGIDQVLPHPVEPTLYESWIADARDYVTLAEQASGPIPRPLDFHELWGDALAELTRAAPAARIANLETSVTNSATPWPAKGINYRMHPHNVPCLTVAGLDCCVLANNHVMDWGVAGLIETLEVLRAAGIRTAGAGMDAAQARAPAVLATPAGRVLVYACGHESSGIPAAWAATDAPGVNLLPDLSAATAARIGEHCNALRQTGDRLVVSIHWGGNWGHAIPEEHIGFAHHLIDLAGADVVHGHSSHHAKAVEVYRDHLVLYGCGDLINDYEGISGHEAFRGDLSLLYFPRLGAGGELLGMRMTPMRMQRMQVRRASREDARWLLQTLDRESTRFGAGMVLTDDGDLALRWT